MKDLKKRKPIFKEEVIYKKEKIDFYDNSTRKERFESFSDNGYNQIFEKTVGNLNNGYLLDVGCASCAFGIRLAKKGFTVIGIDLSRLALLSARQWAAEEGVNLDLVLADVEHMPFKSHKFDICFCGLILHHLPKLNKIAKELSKIMKIDGYMYAIEMNALNPFVWITYNVLHRFYKLSWIATICQRALFPHEVKKDFKRVGFQHLEFTSANFELNPVMQKKKSAFSKMKSKVPFITEKILPKLCKGKLLIISGKR